MKSIRLRAYTANETLTIGEDILAIANASKKRKALHSAILRGLAEVQRTQEILDRASRSREQEDDPLGAAGVRGPMLAARTTFATLADALRGLAELPHGGELSDKAARANEALFVLGTAFLQGATEDLHIQGARVLERAATKENAKLLREIGCAPLVAVAAKNLAELGAARAVRSRKTIQSPSGVTGLAALAQATAALREYAVTVQALDRIEGSNEAAELLAPLVNRRSARRSLANRVERPVVAEGVTPAPETADEDLAPPSRAA